jgi:glutamate-1-semialdehyde 2,1-aminomutase
MTLQRSAEEIALVELAKRVLPAGGFGNIGSDIVLDRGLAGHVWDVSGNEYVDFLLGSGPMFLGHNHPEVTEAVLAQVTKGTTFFTNNEHGIRLAAEIVEAVPCAEQVRFVSSGTEADMYAMRLARAHRGRDKMLKFEGGYHGMSDWALLSLAPKRPGNFPQAVPDSPGIPRAVQNEMLVAPFNDAALAEQMIREHADELAGVIVEPFQRLLPPAPGFLQTLRRVTAELGIPLIFDEVVTGFRFAYGGAQALYGVTPDICTLGKIIGGGFPLAAIVGRADIMQHFDRALAGDAGFLTQVGTLSGNPVAAVAGLASLAVLKRPGAYEGVYAAGQQVMDGLAATLRRFGLPAQVIGCPVMFDVVFATGDIHDYRGTLRADTAMQARINASLRAQGILKSEGKTYMSTAHTAEDVARMVAAFEVAAAAEARQAAE